jgi:alpha-L-fucosidase
MQKNRQHYYNAMVEGMVREICTNYGPLFEIWFDGGASHPDKGAPNVLPIVKKYQPECLFYHNEQLAEARWGGSESGTVEYPCWSTYPYPYTGPGEEVSKDGFALLKHGDAEGKYWVPAMADAPLRGYNGRHEWFWEPGDEDHVYPLSSLVDMYYKSVGRNSTLILGLTPGPDGLMPKEDVERLKEFGAEIRKRFDSPLASTKGSSKRILINLPEAREVNQIVIQEDIAKGHRVMEFEVQALVDGQWKKIDEGTAIGHKYIQLLEKPVKARHFRMQINKNIENPEIINFSLYSVD